MGICVNTCIDAWIIACVNHASMRATIFSSIDFLFGFSDGDILRAFSRARHLASSRETPFFRCAEVNPSIHRFLGVKNDENARVRTLLRTLSHARSASAHAHTPVSKRARKRRVNTNCPLGLFHRRRHRHRHRRRITFHINRLRYRKSICRINIFVAF